MNTKRLCLFICLSFFLGKAIAQTYYYNTTKTFYESGYTYQCDKPSWGLVTLYNKNSTYTYAEWKYKDGTALSKAIMWGNVKLIEDDNCTKQKCYAIVNAAFSADEKKRVKGDEFHIVMTVNTSTGKVDEVCYSFLYNDPYGTIPISTYRKIELNLKSQIWFTLTNTGKQLNFIQVSWTQEVE